MYKKGYGVTQSIEKAFQKKAFQYYKVAADKGDKMAQSYLGRCYYR